jgi:hypothetical protein
MGELVQVAKPYFRWASEYHRSTEPERRHHIRVNQLTALRMIETCAPVKKALDRLVKGKTDGPLHATGP